MVKERAKLTDLVLAIPGSLALIALQIHALTLHHATVRERVLVVSALAVLDRHLHAHLHAQMVMLQHATIREHVLLEFVFAILDSRAMSVRHLHAQMVMIQHATIREHVLLELVLAQLEVLLIVSN